MNIVRYWLTIVGFSFMALALWLYSQRSHADVNVTLHENQTISVICTGSDVGTVVADCKAKFIQLCPKGGVVLEASGSPIDAQPLILTALIKCNPSEAI